VGKNESKWDVEARRIYKVTFIRVSKRIEILTDYILLLRHSYAFWLKACGFLVLKKAHGISIFVTVPFERIICNSVHPFNL